MNLIFQIVSWANVLVLALYFSGPSEDLLDGLLIARAIIPWGEVLIHCCHNVSSVLIWCLKVICTIFHVGCKEYWVCSIEPGHALPVLGSLACLSVSAVGSLFLIGDFAVAINTARFLTSFSALLIFTKSQRFNQMLHTFAGVVDNASALFSALVAISCLYALAGQDIFGNKVQVQPVIGLSLICVCADSRRRV